MTETQSLVDYTVENNIALLAIDNPPVNALAKGVRTGVIESIARANDDDSIAGIVLYAVGKTFPAGADISEFGKSNMEPLLPEVCATLEQSKKPIVAVLHGTPLGGGLELALGAHYRIATASTSMGLPEVTLGLIPGAGGTQRLPRVIDVADAIEFITTGKRIPAQKALDMGLIDQIIDSDDMAGAGVQFMSDIIQQNKTVVGICDRDMINPTYGAEADAIRQTVVKKARGKNAPVQAFEAITFGQTVDFATGMQKEREIFKTLQGDVQSLALRYAFFGARTASKIPNLPRDVQAKDIKNVGIIGMGTMGVGITMCFANAGFHVTSVEVNQDALDAGVERLNKSYAGSVKQGTYTQQFADDCLSRIHPTADLNALQDMDLVLEAVFEKMDVKKDIFAKLDAIVPSDTILATNTSYLDVNEMAGGISHPERFIGLHFFSPAHIMKLLEIVRPDTVSDVTLQTAMTLGKKLKKIGVVAGVCYGFIGNRMLQGYVKQAEYMLEDGASPYEIDTALRKFGFAMGVFSVGDLAGIDIGYFSRRNQDATRPADMRYPGIADKVYELGRLGRKTGQGWYNYADNPKGAPDDVIMDLLDKHRADNGITPRTFSDDDITMRILCSLVNDGAHILSENIAYRASDIDVVWLKGYGFPEYWGGPMFWADHMGLDKILDFVKQQYQTDQYNWQPAPVLEQLVADGKTFADYDKSQA